MELLELTSDRPFEGLKVIDCGSFIAAPAAAMILGDFGADVIKVEPPQGDPYRELVSKPGMPATDRNFPWELDARNKRSIALDLRQPEGQEVLHRLVRQADVFITNLPLATRQRLNVHHQALMVLNPKLIYASFTAYGERGPEAQKTGYDSTAYWGQSGLAELVRPDHRGPPSRPATGMGDHPSAVALFAAIVTALYRRQQTGHGGVVGSSLLANGLWANGVSIQAALCGLEMPIRPPREEAAYPLANYYRCRDGRWLSLALINESQWLPLLQAAEATALAQDPRFVDSEARRAHAAALVSALDGVFTSRDLADWRTRLDAAGLTFGAVPTLQEAALDPQALEGGALVPFEHGPGLTVSSPFEIDGAAKRPAGRAPALGEHGEAVLRELGYAEPAIQRLRDHRVLG